MKRFAARRIADPVHRTIGLSELEMATVSSPAFQRLRNIKQLGLAHLVFPGADYSRLSHSIGVCHVTGQILEALATNCSEFELSEDELQVYRLAGLLHDVGHYPFSHAMEDAIENYVASHILEAPPQGQLPLDAQRGAENAAKTSFLKHEDAGEAIIENDPEISSLLRAAGIEPRNVYSLFRRTSVDRLKNLISSDLDADRIDYLLRTAHHTGLPYGEVDLSFILTQLRLDRSGRICLSRKALRTADHFLLCRYFDYQQVSYHKTVASLEMVLKDVIGALLRDGFINCSAEAIRRMIADGTWQRLDDSSLMTLIKRYIAEGTNSIDRLKASAIIRRSPPKLIGQIEFLDKRDTKTAKRFALIKKTATEKVASWSAKFGIDKSLWYVWDKPGIVLTKIGSHIPASAMMDMTDRDKDKYEQAIRIAKGDDSEDIMSIDTSLMSLLSDSALYALRVYTLFPNGAEKYRDAISAAFQAELADHLD